MGQLPEEQLEWQGMGCHMDLPVQLASGHMGRPGLPGLHKGCMLVRQERQAPCPEVLAVVLERPRSLRMDWQQVGPCCNR